MPQSGAQGIGAASPPRRASGAGGFGYFCQDKSDSRAQRVKAFAFSSRLHDYRRPGKVSEPDPIWSEREPDPTSSINEDFVGEINPTPSLLVTPSSLPQ